MDRPPQRWHDERRPKARGRRLFGTLFSTGAHAAVLIGLLTVHGDPPPPEPEPIVVQLIDIPPDPPPPPPLPTAAPAPEAPPTPKPPVPPRKTVKPPVRPPERPMYVQARVAEKTEVGLTDSQIAGAATAGSGGSGAGACNMAQRVQNALRNDRMARAAVAQAYPASRGRAFVIWNGDWVQSGGEEGKGLAALRQAIAWEVGFAPAECRSQAVNGLVLISMNDGASGTARLALGQGRWRWSDLLH